MAVGENVGSSGVTRFPRRPDGMRGVLNLRGGVVPIVALRCFGPGSTAATPLHVVNVVQLGSRLGGGSPDSSPSTKVS
jgi:chemotaxis signal transduction protein